MSKKSSWLSDGRLRSRACLGGEQVRFGLTKSILELVGLTSLRSVGRPVCPLSRFEELCFTHEGAQACFAFARSAAGCQQGIRSQLKCLAEAQVLLCLLLRFEDFMSRGKCSEARKPDLVWLRLKARRKV